MVCDDGNFSHPIVAIPDILSTVRKITERIKSCRLINATSVAEGRIDQLMVQYPLGVREQRFARYGLNSLDRKAVPVRREV
jgi:hypothetical protein